MIVQVYEIQSPVEAEVMIELGVDHVGSVLLSEERWQEPDLLSGIQMVRAAGRKSSLIPLFGDENVICRALEYYQPDILHFCETLPANARGKEAIARIVERQTLIRQRFPGLELMRSIPIGRNGMQAKVPSLEMATIFEPISDWFLTDTLLINADPSSDQEQPVNGYVGITGQTCDWDVARKLVQKSRIPVILAGGIGPQNVVSGISRVKPAGVDSCTQTNAVDSHGKIQRFQKDPDKVRALVAAARQMGQKISK